METVLLGLFANALFLISLVLAGYLIYQLTARRKLLAFFGVNVSHRIAVYLSNLQVLQGGATGVGGIQYSYQGSAVAFGEMLVANNFRDLFNFFLPSLSDKPGILGKLLISDIQVQLLPSPRDQAQIEKSLSIISLGSPAYSGASAYIEGGLHSRARFDPNVPPLGGMRVGAVPPITDATHGFVERVFDKLSQRPAFYCAGLGELGTIGAAHFLASEWARLYKKYGGQTDFVVMLRFDPTDFRRWSVVFEL